MKDTTMMLLSAAARNRAKPAEVRKARADYQRRQRAMGWGPKLTRAIVNLEALDHWVKEPGGKLWKVS